MLDECFALFPPVQIALLMTASRSGCPRKLTDCPPAGGLSRRLSILAGTDEISSHSLSNSAI